MTKTIWKLIDVETGTELKVGDERKTFRDEAVKITSLEPPHKPEAGGKVHVEYSNGDGVATYYAGVIGARYEQVQP